VDIQLSPTQVTAHIQGKDMAHYARLDERNNVIHVHTLNNSAIKDKEGKEQEQLGVEFLTQHNGGVGWYKQTSYNSNFRKNYAGIGYTYDKSRDAFIPPKQYPSWVLNEDTCRWDAPTPMPDDGQMYTWNEETQAWEITNGN
jgi:hypothetical protein